MYGGLGVGELRRLKQLKDENCSFSILTKRRSLKLTAGSMLIALTRGLELFPNEKLVLVLGF